VQNSSSIQRIDNDLLLDNPTTISGAATTGGISLSGAIAGPGSLTVGIPITLSGLNVALDGAQVYNGALTLGTNMTLTSTASAPITTNSTVNGAHSLTINTAGNTLIASTIGNTTPLLSITTNAAGTTTLSAGAVNTSGAQAYNDPVTLAPPRPSTAPLRGTSRSRPP
jgi:hypothetical protein